MDKTLRGRVREQSPARGDDVMKRQRKVLVDSVVRDYYPHKFSAGQIMKQREEKTQRRREQ